MSKAYNEILEYVMSLKIIDTHEHLPGSEEKRNLDTDVLKEYLTHYFCRDLISSGLDPEKLKMATDTSIPILKRWNMLEEYWEYSQLTGYGRALDITVRDLYGIDGFKRETIEAINEAFLTSLRPGWYEYVLKERSNIEISILDSDLDCDQRYFRSVWRMDNFIYPTKGTQIDEIENMTGIRVTGLDDWMEACEAAMDIAIERGAIALKSGLAYTRSLFYEKTTKADAEVEFNKIFNTNHYIDRGDHVFTLNKKFQDFMMHFILWLANDRNMTFQIHTGIQEGNGNKLSNSDPSLLNNLFMAYPEVDFDIFHMGYPYEHKLSALAKMFPNVFIDMCWAHIISPTASINALVEWLDAMPYNKISAFGGDYCFIDGVYGHQLMARQNVSRALSIKVDAGDIDVNKAKQIAKALFWDNPMRIFKLQGKI